MNMLVIALIVIWIALSIGVTIHTLRTQSCSRKRRQLFVFITWVVPVIGALLALYFTTRVKGPPPSSPSGETMAIDVLAAGTIDTAAPSEHDPR